MRPFLTLLLVLSAVSRIAVAAPPAEIEVNDLKVSLVNDDGRPVTLYAIPSNEDDRNLYFRLTIDPRYAGFKRAVIEIADKEKAVAALIDLGATPRSITRWNGQFSDKKGIDPGERYLVRGVLFMKNGKALSSAWNYFNTKKRSVYDEAKKVRQKTVALYVMPNGAVHSLLLLSKTQRAVNFPNVYGDIQIIYEDTHTLMLKLEATSNILFGIRATPDSYFYSDVSLYYKYRLLGKPVRTPVFPAEDPTGRGKRFNVENAPRLYGEGLNTEVGGRIFTTTLRGAGGAPVDSDLPRSIQGMGVAFWLDYGMDPLRFYLTGELGYSVFSGKMATIGGDFSVVYSRLASFAPGLQFRVQFYKGKSLPDAFSGTTVETDITTALLMAGVVLKFKL